MRQQHKHEKNLFLHRAYEAAIEYHPNNPLSVNINPEELGKTLGYSRSTVDRIMNELVSDGYVSSTLGMQSLLITNAGIRYLDYIDINSFLPINTIGPVKDLTNQLRSGNPVVFISYSHDDNAHQDWVLELANRMTNHGINVILDRYNLGLGANLPHFVETSIERAERIIIIFTPNYKLKAIGRIGGVGYEYSIINNELSQRQTTYNKILPVLRAGNMQDSIPSFLQQLIYIDMRDDSKFESLYEQIIRDIYHEPAVKKPELGTKPQFNNPTTIETIKQPEIMERKKVSGYINPAIAAKLRFSNFACILALANGMTINAGTIREEDGYLVHYTGKGLREMWNPNPMTPEQQKKAQELRNQTEEYLEDNDYIAWTPLDQIIGVTP